MDPNFVFELLGRAYASLAWAQKENAQLQAVLKDLMEKTADNGRPPEE